jgi:hypothetical protein
MTMAADYSSGHGPREQESAGNLVSRLINDAIALVRSEIALAKSEITQAATNAKLGLASIATAFAVLLASALSAVAAIILGLAQVVAPWAAALIVSVALGIVGGVMVAHAKRKFEATKRLAPRTQEGLRQDAAILRGGLR